MNIEQMAREAGVAMTHCFYSHSAELERFAALVRAQALDEAAQVCKTHFLGEPHWSSLEMAAAILALKERT